MIFLRLLWLLICGVFWVIAGGVALFVVALGFSLLLPLGGPMVVLPWPMGAAFILLMLAKSIQRMRRWRAALILMYLSEALRWQLPLPAFLRAAGKGEGWMTGRRLYRTAQELETGRPLSQTLERVVPEMPRRVLGVIYTGERTGRLAEAVRRVSAVEQSQRRQEGRGGIIAFSYGLTLVTMMVWMLGVLGVFIMPKFREIFEDFDAPMPWMTRTTFGAFDQIVGAPLYFVGTVLLLASAGWATWAIFRGAGGWPRVLGDGWDWMIAWVPGIGRLAADRALGDGCAGIEQALSSGATLASAVDGAAAPKLHAPVRRRFRGLARELKRGRDIASASKRAGMPRLVTGLIGANPTKLEPGFAFLSRYYTNRQNRLGALLQGAALPLTVAALSLVFGWVALSMMLPLVRLIYSVMPEGGMV